MKLPGYNSSKNLFGNRRIAGIGAVISVSFIALHPGSAAADWQFDPVIRAAWDFDDNATLSTRTDDEVELSGYMGEASLNLIRTTERSYLSMRPTVRTRNYGDDIEEEEWNADDQFFDLFGIYQGDKNTFRIFGDFSREAVRTAEIADADLDAEADPDEISDDQTGFVNTSARRNRYRLAPRWTYRFSGVSSIESELVYLTTSYDDDDQSSNLFDFTDISFRTEYRRNFSERSSGVFSLRARDFNSDRFGGDRQSVELAGGFVFRLSETTQFRARLGLESVEQEDVGLPTTSIDPQPTVDLTLMRTLETIRFMAQYRQRVNASGFGALTARDEINLRFSRDLSEQVTVGLGARAYSTSTISGVANTQDYVQIRGQVVWRISRSFSVQADYRHTVIDRTSIDGAADSNRMTVWLSWRPNPVGRDNRLRVQF
jgi:hypothetical protein